MCETKQTVRLQARPIPFKIGIVKYYEWDWGEPNRKNQETFNSVMDKFYTRYGR